jgi:hypothetical protein
MSEVRCRSGMEKVAEFSAPIERIYATGERVWVKTADGHTYMVSKTTGALLISEPANA